MATPWIQLKQKGCWCYYCNPVRPYNPNDTLSIWLAKSSRKVACPDCGNKHCPHAYDHRLDCTDSNEPGQPGTG